MRLLKWITVSGAGLLALALVSCMPAGTTANADFNVTAVAKTAGDPYFGVGNAFCFAINGVHEQEITLTRGVTYTFGIDTPGHPFYLTTDPTGGPGAPGEITSGVMGSQTQTGTLTFTPGASTPALIYYQCAVHPDMGWKIDITD